jgi:hypothetical protein
MLQRTELSTGRLIESGEVEKERGLTSHESTPVPFGCPDTQHGYLPAGPT